MFCYSNGVSVSSSIILSFTRMNKLYFFNSIKDCFFFKKQNPEIINNVYNKMCKLRQYLAVSGNDFFQNIDDDNETSFSFFDQFDLFNDNNFNFKAFQSFFFVNKYIKPKLFFRKLKNVNSIFFKYVFDIRAFLPFFFKFLPYNSIVSSNLDLYGAIINNKFFKEVTDFNLTTGDTIKMVFNFKTINYYIRQNINKNSLYNTNSLFSGRENGTFGSFETVPNKDNFYNSRIIKMGSMSLSDLEFSNLNFSVTKVFSVNKFRNSFFIKKFINLYSWRMHEWDRK